MLTSARRPVLVTVGACALAVLLLLSPTTGDVATSGATDGPVTGPVTGAVTATDAVRFRAPGPLTLKAPAVVKVRAKIRFTGRVQVKNQKPRRVRILEKVGPKWRVRATVRSTRTGAFAATLTAAATARTQVFRAEAPAAKGLRLVRSSLAKVKVTAADPVRTEANDWTYLFEGGSRWNPCEEITWAYNPAGEIYGTARDDVETAFENIAEESGLTFVDGGTTDYRQLSSDQDDDFDDFPEEFDVVVSWATPGEADDLAGSVVGIGGGRAVNTVADADVDYRMTQGFLTLDSTAAGIPTGYDQSGWGQVMMHEVLHAMGQGHARWFDTQLMWWQATSRNVHFGAGDRTGMRKVGLPAGCL